MRARRTEGNIGHKESCEVQRIIRNSNVASNTKCNTVHRKYHGTLSVNCNISSLVVNAE